jgi:hypothetical protein
MPYIVPGEIPLEGGWLANRKELLFLEQLPGWR